MAPTNKTNFKSYESAIRLLAAVIATTKPKLDFKAIALHMGRDSTGPSVDHRLRPIKKLAKMQEQYVAEDKNPGDLPVDEKEIQKLFGESTADGIEWQFRSIKKLAKAQQEAAKKGEDTSKYPWLRKRFTSAVKTPTTGGKRSRLQKIDDDLDDDVDDEELEEFDTPTHKKAKFMDGAINQQAPPPSANTPHCGNGQQPLSIFGSGQPQAAAAHAIPHSESVLIHDDDELVEINSSQFSQSSAKSRLQAATRPKIPKQEPVSADVSGSFPDIPQALENSHDVAASFYKPHSFSVVPPHDNSFLSNQSHDDLAEDEV
ncbi:uncharacterized protein PG998_007673 [Apiospora kogelbergensis]|uniref:uncharacterized protein n=1 Tax=Apiospora kogelbergensis TaxID=1337665 RepID=UPI00312F1684